MLNSIVTCTSSPNSLWSNTCFCSSNVEQHGPCVLNGRTSHMQTPWSRHRKQTSVLSSGKRDLMKHPFYITPESDWMFSKLQNPPADWKDQAWNVLLEAFLTDQRV
ncbi:hypothetical protein XENOCAPTIV_024350 [Xenoophorus captivus]|uniref:Uncharacterized protein n=1 Tax=Xenoophorus captivus TaxID=1517983 RepID=A0ABV0SBI0_9TELE